VGGMPSEQYSQTSVASGLFCSGHVTHEQHSWEDPGHLPGHECIALSWLHLHLLEIC
jgi:hypothetical protein